jgi:hypothetical protein
LGDIGKEESGERSEKVITSATHVADVSRYPSGACCGMLFQGAAHPCGVLRERRPASGVGSTVFLGGRIASGEG